MPNSNGKISSKTSSINSQEIFFKLNKNSFIARKLLY
jgi:hypothetical protein